MPKPSKQLDAEIATALNALSPTMRRALKTIIDRYDRSMKHEVTPIGLAVFDIDYRTLQALAKRDMIAIKTKVDEDSELRRGSFGRWIGGTERHTTVTLFVTPTALGRAEAVLPA